MNPSESLRMMWMSQYNPERMTLEDAATTFFNPSSMGLSIVDDLANAHPTTMDLNPMMGIMGGNFNGHAAAAAAAVAASSAAAAAALGVQPTTLLTTNTNELYGLAQMGGLHQQLLQQSAASVFQNYTTVETNEDTGVGGPTSTTAAIAFNNAINAAAAAAAAAAASANGTSQFLTTEELQRQHLQQQQEQQQQLFNQISNNIGVNDVNSNEDNIMANNAEEGEAMVENDGEEVEGEDDSDENGMYADDDELSHKQEIINIDDFVMMTDSNSCEGNEIMPNEEGNKELQLSTDQTELVSGASTSGIASSQTGGDNQGNSPEPKLLETTTLSKDSNDDDHSQIVPDSQKVSTNDVLLSDNNTSNENSASNNEIGVKVESNEFAGSSSRFSLRKTRKIEPVNRPGLVLKTPIAYKGNIDPSVIPIQKDGMAVCERCGAIGVKHTFYTKSRRFCSMACARGELYSLVVNNNNSSSKTVEGGQHQQSMQAQPWNKIMANNGDQLQQQQQQIDANAEFNLRMNRLKNANYRFRITDQSKITQINGFGESVLKNAIGNNLNRTENNILKQNLSSMRESLDDKQENTEKGTEERQLATHHTNTSEHNGNNVRDKESVPCFDGGQLAMLTQQQLEADKCSSAAVSLYRDVMPQGEIPQIPKLEQLPTPCPQLEKIISVRRKLNAPSHSYDWSTRLDRDDFLAAPVTSFPHAPGYDVWYNVGIEMKVEVENTDCDQLEVIQPGQTPHSFWVATILNIQGYKALMRYEGFDNDSHDFWVNLCSAEVHSVGWCATRGKPLIPPRTIEKEYKDWKDFLVGRLSGARTLPSSFYNKINDSMQSRFRLGLNLECVDKDCISQVRLATVTKIVGKRLFLRYFDSDDGFWCHEDSPIIHPVGWATTVGHNLAAPQDYLERMLAGREAMIEVHEDDATIELFKMNFTFEEYYVDGKPNSFIEGMKLEAVDPLNLSSICAATVMAVLKFGYMMIRIDSYQPDASGSDWFCYHEKSPNIFPVGFCDSNDIHLTPPNDYNASTFNWQKYLQDTGSIPAPENLFHRIVPDHGFEVGMSLECADLMDPRLVCVAEVVRVVGRLLKIHFDGWTEEYDQWLDCESADIYPVGWCHLVNHKLEGPPANTSVSLVKPSGKMKVQKRRKKKGTGGSINDQLANSLQGTTTRHKNTGKTCRNAIALKKQPHVPKLSIKLEKKNENSNLMDCDDNGSSNARLSEVQGDESAADGYDEDSSSFQSSQSSAYMMDGINSTITPPIPTLKPTTSGMAFRSTTPETNQQLIGGGPSTSGETINAALNDVFSSDTNLVRDEKIPTVVGNGKYIPRLSDISADSSNSSSSGSSIMQGAHNSHEQQQAGAVAEQLLPETWNVYDVTQFLRVNECTAHCETFSRNKIDGKRFLQLSKDEIITLLGMKVGPALKIYDLIQQLKCKANPSKSRMHKLHTKYL